MAPGPALLENKQERPSREQQATMLLSCHYSWCSPADLKGFGVQCFSFLNQHHAHWMSSPYPVGLLFSNHSQSFAEKWSADAQFLQNVDVIPRLLVSTTYYGTTEVKSYLTWSTQLAALQPEPAVSLRFARLMVIHPLYAPEVRGGTLRTGCRCNGQSCSFNFLQSYLEEKQILPDRAIKSAQ